MTRHKTNWFNEGVKDQRLSKKHASERIAEDFGSKAASEYFRGYQWSEREFESTK